MKNENNHQLSYQVCGKWILAGEHSVLRGGEALVFPLESRFLKVTFNENKQNLKIRFVDSSHESLEQIVWLVVRKLLDKLKIPDSSIKGEIVVDSSIMFGAGMGASATLCVALTHVFFELYKITNIDKYEFSRDLENLFHGESSGVDVAVALNQKPLLFCRNKPFLSFEAKHRPLLYLSHTGKQGATKECVEKVKKLFEYNHKIAMAIDQKMQSAVDQFKAALKADFFSEASWIQAMNQASECFYEWGLVPAEVVQHEKKLLKFGAKAVKLTGSGGGGFMLSYWTEKPPQDVTLDLIPCFNYD